MNFRKTIKKVMALGVGAVFIGATVMSAAAADLKDYPSPFVKDGKFNAVIVVGDEAASSDVIGSVDVATSLQYSSRVKKTISSGTSGGVTLSGDSKKLEEATNVLELGENLTSIRSSVTSSDLTALKDGSITNEFGTFTYTQVVDLPKNAYVRYQKDTSNSAGVHKDDEPADYLVLPTGTGGAGASTYNLRISFSPALKSDHSTAGTNHLEDIKNKKLKLLNKEYDILKADHPSRDNVKLTLMAGSVRSTMSEGETKTFSVEGKEYTVTLDVVTSVDTKFTVNSQITDTLKEADTFKLTDGSELGVVDILYQDFAGGKKVVEFTLGATKIVLEDTDIRTKGTGGTVTIGSTDSSNVKVDIVAGTAGEVDHGNDTTISSIEVFYNASESLFVGKGESASAIAEAVEGESGVFFLNGFDYKYEGLTMDTPEEVKVRPSGNNNYKLAFKNKAGIQYDDFLFGNWSGTINLGQRTGDTTGHYMVVNETVNVTDEDYVVVSRNKYSRILQFKDIAPGSSTSDNVGIVKFNDVGDGKTHEVTYNSLTGNLILDGNTYRVNVSADASGAFVYVDLNGDGTIGGDDDWIGTNSNNAIYTSNEAYITFPSNASIVGRGKTVGADPRTALLQVTSPQDEDNQRSIMGVYLAGTSDGKIDISYVNGSFDNSGETASASSGIYQVGDTQKYQGYAYSLADDGTSVPQYGVYAVWDKKSSTATDQDDVIFKLGKSTTRANVFVASGATTASTTTSTEGATTYYETQPIEVGSAKLASEVSDVTAVNAIVVGGPCANAAAAKLMGNPAQCDAGFTQGKAMIKLYENSGNVAVLVAGYDAMDTRRAARVLAQYDSPSYSSKLQGKEVQVTGTSFTDITVSAVVPTTGNQTA